MSELISIFQQHKINIDNIRNLKEQHLEEFGIKEVGLRMTLLDAIQKYFNSMSKSKFYHQYHRANMPYHSFNAHR